MRRKERRKYIRLPFTLDLSYKLGQDKKGILARSIGIDINQEGIKFLAKEAVEKGAILDLLIKVPGYDETYRFTGKIAWCVKLDKYPNYYTVGVNFIDADKIAMLIARCGGMLYQKYDNFIEP